MRNRRGKSAEASMRNAVLLVPALLLLLPPPPPSEAASRERVRDLEVSEKVAKGTRVGFIGDGTTGDGGPPYLIVTPPGSGVDTDLLVEESTGEIRTKRELDRETRDFYSLLAIPKNGENVRVTVRVLDENDNPPTFPSPFMHIEFPENTRRDVKRTLHPARDLDLGIYNTQRYNIVSGNVNNAFRLSSHRERDGVLYLDLQINGFLDRETTAAYGLVIEALDGGTPPLRGSMTVNITIQDVNDNQPIFNQSRYYATVPENATVGTSVLRVLATDSDAGENGRVEYSINRRQSDREGMFRIDADTGLIAVNRVLDFETKEVHELAVVARDRGEQPLETTAFISIRVTDVNDNQPTINVIFLSDDATPKISESAQPGEFVARISVNDPDSKTEYSNVSVTLEGGEGHFGLATRDNIIYLVIVALPIDRESRSDYTLSVIATDTGSPPLRASRTFHLRVTDVNDNAPEFDRGEYEAEVPESAEPGTSVLRVVARDRDEGENSVLTYSIADAASGYADWFQIDARSGLITTRAPVDCETAPEPRLTVRAVDSGSPPLSSETTVRITVRDVNDNEPVFLQTFYNTSVREDVDRGHCFVKVTANDSDCGVNARVNYTLGEDSGRPEEFEVRPDTGEICVSTKLDYERKKAYEFPVVASDRGGLRTTAIVKVLVTDVNDNRPVFYPRSYNVSLGSKIGGPGPTTPIVAVAARDLDSGKFGTVAYRIVAGNEGDPFGIDRDTGEMFVLRPSLLSSRPAREYRVNVSAVDGGGLESERDAVVRVSLSDPARGPPVFERRKYEFRVREGVPRDTVVGTVKAARERQGSADPILYRIDSGDPDGNFSIDAEGGVIRTASTIDREVRSSVLLNVQATSGEPPAYGHAQVNIVIEDANDNPPEFDSESVQISVPEDAEPGRPLYQAHARDGDSGRNGLVSYRLVGGHGEEAIFRVDPASGHLTLTRPLDYETARRHSLVVVATDAGVPELSSNLSLAVEVQDVNDNPPVFDRDEYSVGVLESLPPGSEVLKVTAVDRDTGNNARLTYRIEGNRSSEGVEDAFGIAASGGSVYLKRQLDREARGRYAIAVSATDNGSPPIAAVARVVVDVLDANDNDPKFARESYRFAIEENSPAGAFVGRVSATDADLDGNGVVRYFFIPGDSSFRIDPATGDIFAKEPLDRESKSAYELVAEARDQGVPARSSRIPVKIVVADVNDNVPELVDPREDVVSVREEQPPGTEVTRVKAIDRDEGNNATITYSILKSRDSDGFGVFSVDPVTGSVRTRTTLDHEERSIYRLAVAATDGGRPPQQTVRVLRVEVLDVSDHRPTFTSSSLFFEVREDAEIGHVVGNVAPSEPTHIATAGEKAASVRYAVTSVSGTVADEPEGGPPAFEIDKIGGNLVVSRQLDREKQSEYVLEVRALDTSASNNPQSSAVTVRIEVTDVNDNAPRWPAGPIAILLPEDTPVGTVVSNYSATDADAGENADLRYELAHAFPEAGARVFSVDALTGMVTLEGPLDFEQLSEFTLVLRAVDRAANASERRSASAAFVVTVLDANDHEPTFVSPTSDRLLLRDSTRVGAVVAEFVAVDGDSGENGRVSYAISSGNEDGRFSLGPDSGLLTLARPFLEDGLVPNETFPVNVTATDHGTPPSKKTFSLRIVVRGSSDAPPKFTESAYEASVPENAPAGTVVCVVEATLPAAENGERRNITFRIARGVADDKFAVDPRDGTVTTKAPLDREEQEHYRIPVYVSDESGRFPADAAVVSVAILDANDHAPEFKRGSCYPIRVPENSDLSVIHKVVAHDADSGVNGEITYSIVSGNVGNKFSMDLHSGLLSARPLDREARAEYVLVVAAQDRGSPRPLQGTCNLTIYVDDENDNDPRFTQEKYSAFIPEDTPPETDVLAVEAIDADVGVNSRLVYSIANESHWLFRIDNRSGVISTAGWFDREKRDVYEFQVVVTDGGTYDARSRRVSVKITVTDVNDNDPTFASYPFVARVPGYVQAGASLLRVAATDADEGANAEVVYSFATNSSGDKFKIDPNTGAVTASSSLTGDSGKVFRLEVVARDRGNPPRSVAGLVEIRVGGDPELPALRFRNETYEVRVAENSPDGKRIVRVSAVRTDGRRQKIEYSFGGDARGRAFEIDRDTGWVRVGNGGKLDFEEAREMTLPLVAEGDGSLFGYSRLRVLLEDVNDNPPRFTQEHYSASVWEGNNKGTFVIQVSANDPDDGVNSRVLYHIVDGNHDNAFAIEPPFSGLVKTNIVLDREIRDTYRLTIIATDEGSPQLTGTATLRIDIVDANDNQPTFPPHSVISVSEGTDVGTVVAAVTANDVDTNPTLTYSFAEENEETAAFSIDRFSGKIVLGQKLDYEKKKEFRLRVTASDSAHAAHTSVVVRVTDANDNAPTFLQSAYLAALPGGGEAMRPLLTVNATDADSGSNAKIKYSIATPVRGVSIDAGKGTVFVDGSLLSAAAAAEGVGDVEIAVAATDQGRPPLRGFASVRIRVSNDRDRLPQFTQEEYQIRIREDSRRGTGLLRLAPVDPGKDAAGNIEFRITGGDEDGAFQIVSPSGELVLVKDLDRERKSSYSLSVSVGTEGFAVGNATVCVSVEDANDNAPRFGGVTEGGVYEAVVSELAPTGTSVAAVFAEDGDLPGGPNAELGYEIIAGNDEGLFAIDPKAGVVRVNRPLDYDSGPTAYELVVRASDGGTSPDRVLAGLARVRILLEDENDNAPAFPVTEYLEFVAENEAVGTSVFAARAVDRDRGRFGAVNYSIVPGEGADAGWKLFRVDPATGVVASNAVFDYETRSRYRFAVRAVDAGGRATEVRVRVEIESRDEFPPQFSDRTYRFAIPPPGRGGLLPVGHAIGSVEATDRDAGPDGRVVYQLTTQQAFFKINRTTGAILVKRKLNEMAADAAGEVSFIVTASSGKQGSLTNTTVVEIAFDPLAARGTNLASGVDGENPGGGLADWALGLLIALVLMLLVFGGVFLFLHVRSRRQKKVNKGPLNAGAMGAPEGFVDPGAFDAIPIRGGGGGGGGGGGMQAGGQFAPPKYDEIPPYGNGHRTGSGSGNATTSELSGSEQSGSSGRGSAEDGEDVEDEEIRMINEGPLQRDGGIRLQSLDEDNMSDVSVHNTQEYLARLGIVDNAGASGAGSSVSRRSSETLVGGGAVGGGCVKDPLPAFDEEAGAEADIGNLIYAKLNDSSERGGAEEAGRGILSGFDVPGVNGIGTQQPSMTGSLSSIVHSEEELTGSYNWDYLLDWGPQYQPLAHVFSEIARLKDDAASVQSTNSGSASSKGGKGAVSAPKTLPPPLLTSVAPRSIAAPVIAARGPGRAGHRGPPAARAAGPQHQLLLLPRSPIGHDATGAGFSTSSAMSPSFSPSLSPLATRSPSISPLVAPGATATHRVVSMPRQGQRSAVAEGELRI